MWAASSNVAGINELGKDVYIRHKTAMSEIWTTFSMVCIMQFQYFIRQLPLFTLVYCINITHLSDSPYAGRNSDENSQKIVVGKL
jgi:hypothetical protein